MVIARYPKRVTKRIEAVPDKPVYSVAGVRHFSKARSGAPGTTLHFMYRHCVRSAGTAHDEPPKSDLQLPPSRGRSALRAEAESRRKTVRLAIWPKPTH